MQAKILVVDDEVAVRRSTVRVLERAGYVVDAASDGLEAQAQLRSVAYDAAVVDLGLPGLSGLDLLSWMAQEAPGVVAVVLSGTSRIEDAIQAVQRGAFDYVAKPIESTRNFEQHVHRAIAHKQLRDAHRQLLIERESQNRELETRLSQLELAYQILHSQTMSMHADLQRAKRIQHALLPKTLPFPERISMSSIYRPAAQVGGDMYDVFQLDDHHIGAYIADTAGHGVSSALLTVYLRLAVKPVAEVSREYRIVEPAAMLRALNYMIFQESFGYDLFTSMIYLVMNTITGEVRYANAGHPRILIRRAEGLVELSRPEQSFPALGLCGNTPYAQETFFLEPGDLLLLYTDGVQDCRNEAGAFYGSERLRQALINAPGDVNRVTQSIESDLNQFRAHSLFGDDITVLALGRMPQTQPYVPPKVTDEVMRFDEHAATPGVRGAFSDGRLFIALAGTGSWRESERVESLVARGRAEGRQSIILDFSQCTHLDSTFLGVLHELVTKANECTQCRIELQNVPPPVLREMNELGLQTALSRLRSKPLPLPSSMEAAESTGRQGTELGQFLLHAHEALVNADPHNADRFAEVLRVLQSRVAQARASEIHAEPEPPQA